VTDAKKPALTMVGAPDAAVCVDGTCELPPPVTGEEQTVR
jgi:hypothetical protein